MERAASTVLVHGGQLRPVVYGAPPETQSVLSAACGRPGIRRLRPQPAVRRPGPGVCYVKTPSACPLAEVSDTYEGAAWRLCE